MRVRPFIAFISWIEEGRNLRLPQLCFPLVSSKMVSHEREYDCCVSHFSEGCLLTILTWRWILRRQEWKGAAKRQNPKSTQPNQDAEPAWPAKTRKRASTRQEETRTIQDCVAVHWEPRPLRHYHQLSNHNKYFKRTATTLQKHHQQHVYHQHHQLGSSVRRLDINSRKVDKATLRLSNHIW